MENVIHCSLKQRLCIYIISFARALSDVRTATTHQRVGSRSEMIGIVLRAAGEKSQEGCPDSLSAAGQGVRRCERVTVGGGRLP